MKQRTRHHETDLAVIGAGLCGSAATLFALNRDIKTTQIGNTGALAFTSGYFDLLGVDRATVIEDPWQGLERLRQDQPQHPYANTSNQCIRSAFKEFVSALNAMGLGYTEPGDHNMLSLLPGGATKPTLCMPQTMHRGAEALAAKAPTLIIDFAGLQGFSAREISEVLSPGWPDLTTETIPFPGMQCASPLYAEVMARSLEVSRTCEALARSIKTIAGDAEYIGLPAILGIHHPDTVHRNLQNRIGLPVFEIPTIPPAVAGIRLRELLEQQLAQRGADVVTQYKVERVDFAQDQVELSYHDHFGKVVVAARHVLLASGRFLSGGLGADRDRIFESLIGLPLQQPGQRDEWFNADYFDPGGHAVNRAGVRVNQDFQPVDANHQVIDPRLFAGGILLANQDWIRQRSGAGIALSSAYRAIQVIAAQPAHCP
jgi:glycerol-3-phosphate dehydrogenase subunit B